MSEMQGQLTDWRDNVAKDVVLVAFLGQCLGKADLREFRSYLDQCLLPGPHVE